MHRRQFMAAAAGGIVAGAIGGCVSEFEQIGQSNGCGSLECRATLRVVAIRKDRVRRARERTGRLVPARLPAQQLSVARRLRPPRRRTSLCRGGFPRPRIHGGRAGTKLRAECAGRDARGAARLAFDLDSRPHRERQRRCRRAAVRPALSAARSHDAADELRRRARQPAARAEAGSRSVTRGQVCRCVARAVGREQVAGAQQGRAGRPDVHLSRESHRRGDRPIPRAARELAGAQGAGACIRARARSESARRHRGIAQALHRADADHLGHRRSDLLGGKPGLPRPPACRTRAACDASRARSCSSRRSSRT